MKVKNKGFVTCARPNAQADLCGSSMEIERPWPTSERLSPFGSGYVTVENIPHSERCVSVSVTTGAEVFGVTDDLCRRW